MMRTCSLLAGFLILWITGISHADLIITMTPSSNTYNVGDVGTVDLMIHSNNSPNDLVDSFLFDLNVTGPVGLTFVTPQPETYLTDPNYVFAGRSANVALNFPATDVSNAGRTLTALDVTFDFTPATLGNALPMPIPDSNSPLLLGRFAFTAGSAGNFSIAVDPSSSFSDVNFNTFNYTSNLANFTVTAVPEPSSFSLMFVSIGATIAVARWRKRRTQHGKTETNDTNR